jgi:uncharacterized membrane protein
MIDDLIPVATVVAAVGSALVAGLMLAFSVAVMPALARRPAHEAMATMQVINRAILNPVFGLVFGGATIACLVVLVTAPLSDHPGATGRVVGALLYLVGSFGVTAAVNVPLNNAVDAADPATPEGERLWSHYLSRWTAWNHLRTLAGTAGAAVLTVALHW